MDYRKLFKIGIVNTIRINFHYFGIKGVIMPAILVTRHAKIQSLKGKVILKQQSFGAIQIGLNYVGIIDDSKQRCVFENNGTIIFDGKCILGVGTKVCCSEVGQLHFGDNCIINGNSTVIATNYIEIGEECLISWETLIMDTDYHNIYSNTTNKILNPSKPIIIGKKVWIGCRTTVLKGSYIPDGCIIAACSKVSHRFEGNNSLIINNEKIKENIYW